jgi:hypothetical protein
MRKLSRRSLLSGTGSVLALGVAGCLESSDPSDEPTEESPVEPTDEPTDEPTEDPRTGDAANLPEGLATAFKYVYEPEDDSAVVFALKFEEDRERALPTGNVPPFIGEDSTLEWGVRLQTELSGRPDGLVATGSVSIDESAETISARSSRGDFQLYDIEPSTEDAPERVIATDGEVLLFGVTNWVTDTLDSHAAGKETYLAARPGARFLLDTIGVDAYAAIVEGESQIEEAVGREEMDLENPPSLLGVRASQNEDTQSFVMAGWYPEGAANEAVSEFEQFFETVYGETEAAPEIRRDNRLVMIEVTKEYVPPEERDEPPHNVYFQSYDEESGEVLLELRDGDEIPVENLEIEIDDETYEGDWARGKDRIADGDVIAIDAGAIEPGDSITIKYSPDANYGSSYGTQILRHLPFRVDFDPIEGRARIEYADGPPLSADRVSVKINDDRTLNPWNGTLQSGDATTVENVEIKDRVMINYERDDGDSVSIGRAHLRPPGWFEIEYDGTTEEVSVRYPVRDDEDRAPWDNTPEAEQQPITAGRYEIRLDGEPADKQWTDLGKTIEPGDQLRLSGVSTDTEVSVVWVGPEREYVMEKLQTVPEISFEYEYADGKLTIQHAGKQPVPAEKLRVEVVPDEREISWSGTGRVTEGDEFVVEDLSKENMVIIFYDETYLDRVRIVELSSEQKTETASESLTSPSAIGL